MRLSLFQYVFLQEAQRGCIIQGICFSWFLFSVIKFLFPDFDAVESFFVGFCICRTVELSF